MQMMKAQNFNDRLFLLTFSVVLFLSALLLFYIQPILGKALLPKLGGTPQVWNTCMVFFQAMLLAGYLHAHYSGVWFGIRGQALIHLILAIASLFALPVIFINDMLLNTIHPIIWLIQTLLISIGIPFFILSSTAPILQKWFSATTHPSANDPYFLYVASNLGSLFALISYPIIIEPFFDLHQQNTFVRVGIVTLVIGLISCAVLMHRNYASSTVNKISENLEHNEKIIWRQRIYWLMLSLVPSSLLTGVTTFITTDIAAVPFLWVLPLALYLLTFIIAFAKKIYVRKIRILRIQVITITLLCAIQLMGMHIGALATLSLHLVAFFTSALLCHYQLVESRPHSKNLTEFYLWLSVGGFVGGAFNTLLAPVIFNQLFEYPLALLAACLLRPTSYLSKDTQETRRLALMIIGAMCFVFIVWGVISKSLGSSTFLLSILWGMLILTNLGFIRAKDNSVKSTIHVALGLITLPLLLKLYAVIFPQSTEVISRNFFGIYRVVYNKGLNINSLSNGTTLHGAQSQDPAISLRPIMYYHPTGPFGDLFRALDNKLADGNIAVIGLGAGALSCYGGKDSTWTYYEINPLVEKIARNSQYFTYLRDCPPKVNVLINDARLGLRSAPDHHYNVIVVDAFSSDSIPAHLLTREAIDSYLTKLTANGVLAIHISNRYLNLEDVIGNLAYNMKLVGKVNNATKKGKSSASDKFSSTAQLVLLARNETDFGSINKDPNWNALQFSPGKRVWTDDYVNIFSALK